MPRSVNLLSANSPHKMVKHTQTFRQLIVGLFLKELSLFEFFVVKDLSLLKLEFGARFTYWPNFW